MQVVSQSKKNKILEVKELKLEPSQFRWKNEYQSSYHPQACQTSQGAHGPRL